MIDPILRHEFIVDWFSGTQLRVSTRVEGTRWMSRDFCFDGLTFGLRAGPDFCMGNLFHEVAHFLEIDEARMLRPGFGLRSPPWISVPGFPSFPADPVTSSMTQREIRVCGIQTVLQRAYRYIDPDYEPTSLARSLRWLPDHLTHRDEVCQLLKIETGLGPDDDVYEYHSELVHSYTAQMIEAEAAKHTIHSLFATWLRRASIHDAYLGKELLREDR